ncbi:MAG: 3-oxoacyl-ACP synthase [Rhodospirillaceae bacterium BRH_c57]|nr:MAG: 3-oxoacyl-ACP synthase [Rhodospirillaceae bacterium BRH_c57]
MVIRSVIVGTGACLPERIVTNAEISRMIDTTDEWIVERTGIRQRHLAGDGEKTSDLALGAARNALAAAGVDGRDVDLIILATATPDQTFPATAAAVQRELGCVGIPAFDLQAVCSGFVYALTVADNFIKAGQARTALVIGAETFSRILDWTDRGTCVLFGDGAGAVVLKAEQGEGTTDDRGILTTHLHADGRQNDLLYVDGGPSSTGTTGHLRMHGREVFRHAVVNLAAVVQEALEATGLTSDDIDWLVPHQANKRILDGTAKKLGISPDKVVVTVDRHANTSAASIPLALAEAVADGRIQPGQLVLLEAMGGGFTWGSALVRM